MANIYFESTSALETNKTFQGINFCGSKVALSEFLFTGIYILENFVLRCVWGGRKGKEKWLLFGKI